jgi:hypothetical protein
MFMCYVVFSYYVLCISLHPYFCLSTSSELMCFFSHVAIIIILVYLHCAVSVIGLVAVDSA